MLRCGLYVLGRKCSSRTHTIHYTAAVRRMVMVFRRLPHRMGKCDGTFPCICSYFQVMQQLNTPSRFLSLENPERRMAWREMGHIRAISPFNGDSQISPLRGIRRTRGSKLLSHSSLSQVKTIKRCRNPMPEESPLFSHGALCIWAPT